MVKSMVDKTISLLNKMKSAQNDGPWQKKLSVIAEECSIDLTKMDKFNSTVREPFLTELIDNIETRYVKNFIKYQLLGNQIFMLSYILAIIFFFVGL